MSQLSEHYSANNNSVASKGTEIFVGGLPRTISEDEIRSIFSSCGEIMEIRLIKDNKGNPKGFCFVRFTTKDAADRAISEKSGTMLDGKKIGVLPSTQQETLYFGSLNKAWGAEEFKQIVLQVLTDVASVDLVMLKDVQPGQKQQNRGFAFVKFSSHAAASRAQRVASQPDFRLGNLHPIVQWAEEEPEVDQQVLSEIKIAFVRSLPADADEDFLKQLFEPFGKVEKVVVCKKSNFPVGFVHFMERSGLDRSVKALNEKMIQGRKGSMHKLQVEVARPMDKSKKRARDNAESHLSLQVRPKSLKEETNPIFSNRSSFVQKQEIESMDPYEDAVLALPLAVKERLLRILRLGIATRFDIDVISLRSLKELPESTAIHVLDQFMLSGGSSKNKALYLAELISKYLVDKVGLSRQNLVSLTRVEHTTTNDSDRFRYSPQVSPQLASLAHSTMARCDMYGTRNISPLSDYHLPSRTLTGRSDEQSPDYLRPNRALSGAHTLIGRQEQGDSDYLLPSRPLPGHQTLINRAESGSDIYLPSQSLSGHQIRIGRVEDRIHSSHELSAGPSEAFSKTGSRMEEAYFPPSTYTRHEINLHSDVKAGTGQQGTRPQMRFDPFTGEPYKFDPFTGEPIRPESGSGTRQF